MTVNLIRPVPVAELHVSARVLREGSKIQLLEVELRAEGILVTRGEVLRVKRGASGDAACLPPLDLPGPSFGSRTRPPTGVGFSRLFEMLAVRGTFETPGPASIWFRMLGELVAGEETDAVTATLACADFANGIGSAVSFAQWSYPNADLTVSLARQPSGPWILLDAECWVGSDGRGMTHARIGDAGGWFGRSLQTTLIERRAKESVSER
ncbi:hypothetical protein ACVWZA_000716 [Sphingomonas sp. UYAg733]